MKTTSIHDALDLLSQTPEAAKDIDGTYEAAITSAEYEVTAIEASDLQARVADFHRACGLPVASEPTVGTPEQRELRVRLMLEEVLEFAHASGVRVFSTVGRHGVVHGVCDLAFEEADDRSLIWRR